MHTRKETNNNKKKELYTEVWMVLEERNPCTFPHTTYHTKKERMGNKQNKTTPFSSEIKHRYIPIFRADGGVHKNSPTTAM